MAVAAAEVAVGLALMVAIFRSKHSVDIDQMNSLKGLAGETSMLLSEATGINPMFNLVPWVVFLPVIGILLNWLVGKRLGEKGIGAIASLASGGSFVVSVLLMIALSGHHEGVNVPLFTWLSLGSINLDWVFRVDTLSVVMMLVVSAVLEP